MKTNRAAFISGLILVGLAGFGVSQDKNGRPASNRPAEARKPATSQSGPTSPGEADYPVIGHLEKRDRIITIKSGPKETLYTVKSADGKVLCENVSVEALRAQAPELHDFIKTAMAGGSAVSDARVRPKLDASAR